MRVKTSYGFKGNHQSSHIYEVDSVIAEKERAFGLSKTSCKLLVIATEIIHKRDMKERERWNAAAKLTIKWHSYELYTEIKIVTKNC